MKKSIFLLIVFFILFVLTADLVFAEASAVKIEPFGPKTWEELFKKITDVVSLVIGSVAGIMIVVAGILFLTSAGDPKRLTLAKQCLTYAIIGLVIALAAQAIVATIKTITD